MYNHRQNDRRVEVFKICEIFNKENLILGHVKCSFYYNLFKNDWKFRLLLYIITNLQKKMLFGLDTS